MGWVWRDDDDDEDVLGSSRGDVNTFRNPNPSTADRCSTRKIVKSNCRTEEVEPGKFVRKCEKTEQILRDCVGKAVEVVQSNKETTEEDVTDEILRGPSNVGSSESGIFDFPGLRGDIETIERNFLDGFGRFFEAAEEMKNGFFEVFGRTPHVFCDESVSQPSTRKSIPVERPPQPQVNPNVKEFESSHADLAGLARDV